MLCTSATCIRPSRRCSQHLISFRVRAALTQHWDPPSESADQIQFHHSIWNILIGQRLHRATSTPVGLPHTRLIHVLLSAPCQGCSFHYTYVARITATPCGAQWVLTLPERSMVGVGKDNLCFLQEGDDLTSFSGLVWMFNKVKNTGQPVWSGARHLVKRKCHLLSRIWLSVTPWTVACQVPLSMKMFRQEYWSGLPCPSLGDLPIPGLNLGLPHHGWILYHLSPHQGSRCTECIRSFSFLSLPIILPWAPCDGREEKVHPYF